MTAIMKEFSERRKKFVTGIGESDNKLNAVAEAIDRMIEGPFPEIAKHLLEAKVRITEGRISLKNALTVKK